MTDLDERLSGEYAALRDTPAVMRSAVGYLEELQGAVIRLGDAIEQGGLPGKLWRSDEADLAALGDIFPLITIDELITRLSQFASERGPAWLRGGGADLAAFQDEARILYDVMHALRVTAQRLRMSGGSGKSQLERAFSNARIGAPLDRVAILLETLDALGPFMAPISPNEWAAPAPLDSAAGSGFLTFGASPASDELFSASENQSRGLLRDYAPAGGAGASLRPNKSGKTGGLWIQLDIPKGPALLRNRWVLGVAGALLVGALVAFLVVRSPILAGAKKTPTATPPPAVVANPTSLILLCSTRKTAALTLKNQSAAPVTWQAKVPTTVAITPAQGTIPAGQSVTLQAHLTSAKATTGTITITEGKTTLSIPFSATC
ncbi:MAG TPA: hypothetical protein VHR15_18395 [Ktedonobacterales bacterium]|nr:hypothetical protein [Ktedonobacterales bacterium]